MFYSKVSALFIVQHVLNLVLPFEIEMLVLHSVVVCNIAGVVLLVQDFLFKESNQSYYHFPCIYLFLKL